ncbi:MAG: succinate dehydrogenase/fumarate reductase iron-sulfur subunit [Spirochaetales bacterium]
MNERDISIYRTSGELETYSVPINDRTTVIDALEYIRLTYDENLMFRQSCHHGSCGTCGMAVNGKFVLACTERIADQDAEKAVRVEPLPTMPRMGDLAYDPSGFMQEFPEGLTYLRESDLNKDAETPEDIDAYTRFENCIECGLCVTACPVTESWMGPASLAAIHRELEKHPERKEELLDMAEAPRGVDNCTRDFSCVWVCPTDVKPGQRIVKLQGQLKKRAKAREKEQAEDRNSE